MKHNCPFCKKSLTYRDYVERGYIYSCDKCLLGLYYKYRTYYRSDGYLYEISIILNHNNNNYLLSVGDTMFGDSTVVLNKILGERALSHVMHLTTKTKIDLVGPINSGLSILNRLLKLRAFS